MSVKTSEWLKGILTSEKRFAMPILTNPVIDLLDGIEIDEVITDAEVHYQVIKGCRDLFPDCAALTTVMDLTVEAEMFGSTVNFHEGELPAVSEPIINTMAEAEALQVPGMDVGRGKNVVEAARLAVERIPDRPIFGGILGPISIAGVLFGMTPLMMALIEEPKMVHVVMQKITDFLIDFCKEFKKVGCNGIFIAEPTAGLLADDQCEEFSSKYNKQLVDALQDDEFMMIYHNCGTCGHLMESILGIGCKGLHFGTMDDLSDLAKVTPDDVLIMGNINPAVVMFGGTPETVKNAVNELLDKLGQKKNFVLSTGCDLPPRVSKENLDMFFETLKIYNEKINQ